LVYAVVPAAQADALGPIFEGLYEMNRVILIG
jgi:hypothetical protein